LQTVKKEEMNFSANYRVKIRDSDKVSGVVVWFDCYFTHGRKQILLSTSSVFKLGPFLQRTHWKQTIFYFEKSFYGKEGHIVKGTIVAKRG
jgi:hypothetical protein